MRMLLLPRPRGENAGFLYDGKIFVHVEGIPLGKAEDADGVHLNGGSHLVGDLVRNVRGRISLLRHS